MYHKTDYYVNATMSISSDPHDSPQPIPNPCPHRLCNWGISSWPVGYGSPVHAHSASSVCRQRRPPLMPKRFSGSYGWSDKRTGNSYTDCKTDSAFHYFSKAIISLSLLISGHRFNEPFFELTPITTNLCVSPFAKWLRCSFDSSRTSFG